MTLQAWFSRLRAQKSLLIALALTAVAFGVSLQNQFVWDDHSLVVNNVLYRTLDIKGILLSRANFLEYLPVRDLTMAFDAQLWGMHPFGFHLTNVLLYLLCVTMLFYMLRNLLVLVGQEGGDFLRFWTTLIFAVHPLHAEAVNFVTARNNILAALFLFLSLDFFIAGMRGKKSHSFSLSVAAFTAALFSKASVVFYPLFLVMFLLLVPRMSLSKRKVVLILLPFFVVDGAAIWIHFNNAAATSMMSGEVIRFGHRNPEFIITKALQIPFFYLRMLVFPYPLTVDYPVSFVSGHLLLRSALAGGAIAIAFLSAWNFRKRYPLLSIGIVWYFTSLIPVLNIFPTTPVVADRYAFLSVFGFGIIFSFLLERIRRRQRLFAFLAVGVIAALLYVDVSRSLDWRSDIALWESALTVNPAADRENLAEALWTKGRYERALTLLKEERERNGGFHYDYYRGKYYAISGRQREAIACFLTALAEGGDTRKDVRVSLAQTYEKIGERRRSLDEYLKAIEMPGLDPMGKYTQIAGKRIAPLRNELYPEIGGLRIEATAAPGNFQLQARTALIFHQLGLYEEAAQFYKRALAAKPSSWEARYNLGIVYSKLKKYRRAIEAFNESLAINPNNKDAYNNAGTCSVNLQNYEEAKKYFALALKTDPTYMLPAFNLGRLYFTVGDREQALRYFSLARSLAPGNRPLQARIDVYLLAMQ